MPKNMTAHTVRSLCTPAQHAQAFQAKPVRLLALGTVSHSKTALLEFPGGWERTIDLVTEFDGWHPLFCDLAPEDTQRLRVHTEPAFVKQPDGTLSRPDPLSFLRRLKSARGQAVRWRYFDVPAQDYCEGTATGYRCAAELLEAMALGYGPHIQLREVLEEAAQAAKEGAGGDSRCGAAGAFLRVMGEAILFFAKHADHRAGLAEKIAGTDRYRRDTAERRAIERAGFTERMRASKTASRQAEQTQARLFAARADERLQDFLKGMNVGAPNANGGAA
jgi:hypothetical protein